jgi:predicted nucleic acid-binding protein
MLLILSFLYSEAQELKCNISVSSQQIQGTNKKIFQTLNTALNEFMNNKSWTTHVYTLAERIECNILINVTSQVSADEFKGTIQVQSRRPVFNSSYNTALFNYMDQNFNFTYVEFEPLEFNENTHQSNLTCVLAYYAYMILGFDYDSFSLEGGSDFFAKADKIVENAQSSQDIGWKPFEAKGNKNRYWLVKNVLDKRYESVREFCYRYHRLGLDVMDSKPGDGRAEIAEDLLLMQKVYRDKPDAFLHYYHVVFESKADELVNIFSESMPDEKTRVYQILNEIDNANDIKYKKLTQAN